MNDKKLDQMLDKARDQSKAFFDSFDFDHSQRMVYKKIENKQQTKPNSIGMLFGGRLAAGIVALCILAVVMLYIPYQSGNRPISAGDPVLQQAIGSDSKDSFMVNYFRLNNPSRNNNLLAVLWQKNRKGGYEMVYSSIMENTDIPNPVSVIKIPSADSSFAVVSSSNRDEGFIHYRLIKFGSNSTTAYIEEDYVPKGKIEIINGMIIEERTVPMDFNINNHSEGLSLADKAYRYYIPIELRSDGSLAPAASRIRLKKGAILTLLLDSAIEHTELEYDSNILNKKGDVLGFSDTLIPSIDFEVINGGYANLRIGPKSSTGISNELLIEVVD
jgi:hypothetical protein